MGKVRLKGGPKNNEVMIVPDDILMLLLVRKSRMPEDPEEFFTDTPEDYDRYVIDDFGVGTYEPSIKRRSVS